MNIYKQDAAILLAGIILLAGMLLFLYGYGPIESSAPVAPGAQVIPVPIPGVYIQDGAITTNKIANGSILVGDIAPNAVNDTQLAPNAINYNVTFNNTGGTKTNTAMSPIYNNGSITLNRTSLIVVQFSGEVGVDFTNKAYLNMQFGGVNMTTSPTIIVSSTNDTYSAFGTRTVVFYNASAGAGTYTIVPLMNGSSATAVVSYGKSSIVTMAYPHN